MDIVLERLHQRILIKLTLTCEYYDSASKIQLGERHGLYHCIQQWPLLISSIWIASKFSVAINMAHPATAMINFR